VWVNCYNVFDAAQVIDDGGSDGYCNMLAKHANAHDV